MATKASMLLIRSIYFQIKYTGYRDRSHEERIVRFQTEARDGQATVVSWLKLLLKLEKSLQRLSDMHRSR